MNKTNENCEGCTYMGIWGICRYCNNKFECKENKLYTNKWK